MPITTQTIFSRRPCKAFTLIELMVVVGIIALVIGFLIPVFNTARKRADHHVQDGVPVD